MLNFKIPKTIEEAVSVYKSIQYEAAEFKQTQSNEELTKSYLLAQRQIIEEDISKYEI